MVSYTTVSALPRYGILVTGISLLRFPAGHPGPLLAATLPFGARTFLGRICREATDPDAAARPAQVFETRTWYGMPPHVMIAGNAQDGDLPDHAAPSRGSTPPGQGNRASSPDTDLNRGPIPYHGITLPD